MASDTYKAHIKRVPSKAGVKTVPPASIVVARGMVEGGGAFILPSLTHCTMCIPQSTVAVSLVSGWPREARRFRRTSFSQG